MLYPVPESWLVAVVMARSDLIKATQHFGRWVSLASFAGLVVGVDVSCWIYLCLSTSAAAWAVTGDYTTTVRLIMERVEALARTGIIPLIVLDGKPLPGKAEEASTRMKARASARQSLLAHLDAGNDLRDADALRLARRMASRTPELTNALIRTLWQHGYNFVVAPHEADIQLAHLQRTGAIAAAVTGDGDLQMLGLQVANRCFVPVAAVFSAERAAGKWRRGATGRGAHHTVRQGVVWRGGDVRIGP